MVKSASTITKADNGVNIFTSVPTMAHRSEAQGFESPQEYRDDPYGCVSAIPDGTDPNWPVRVYADGIYDLFHFGHARSLEQAKKLFPHTYLLVGCCGDAVTHAYKGKTVMTQEERYESLRHCRWVDEVVEDAPWVVGPEFLAAHQIHYVAHDDLPYADASGSANDVYDFVKKAGRFRATKRTDGISTSDLILRITREYSRYVMRNLKRGYTGREMGVSALYERQLRLSMGLEDLHLQWRKQLSDVAGYLPAMWTHERERWLGGFLRRFDAGYQFMERAIQSRFRKTPLRTRDKKGSKGRERSLHGIVANDVASKGSVSEALQEVISAT